MDVGVGGGGGAQGVKSPPVKILGRNELISCSLVIRSECPHLKLFSREV